MTIENALGKDEIYCTKCGEIISKNAIYCSHCGINQRTGIIRPDLHLIDGRNKFNAGLLAIFLGGLGAHKFYMGKVRTGIIYILFCWTLIPTLVSIAEGIIYLSDSEESFERRLY